MTNITDLFTRNEVPCESVAQIIAEKLTDGLFLTTYAEELSPAPNTMTIGWGGLIRFFHTPIFLVPVRKSRFTYALLEKSGEFTVSVPLHDMKAELAFAGTKSGRDFCKFEGHGLTAAPAIEVPAPIVKECELHFECKVVGTTDLAWEGVDEEKRNRWYADHNMHMLFLGEVLRCYFPNDAPIRVSYERQ